MPPEPHLAATSDAPFASVRKARAHDSAERHVQGSALYIDDLAEPRGTLHIAPGYAPDAAAGRIVRMDLDPVRAAPGVVAVPSVATVFVMHHTTALYI